MYKFLLVLQCEGGIFCSRTAHIRVPVVRGDFFGAVYS
jgi:hypothetical protein